MHVCHWTNLEYQPHIKQNILPHCHPHFRKIIKRQLLCNFYPKPEFGWLAVFPLVSLYIFPQSHCIYETEKRKALLLPMCDSLNSLLSFHSTWYCLFWHFLVSPGSHIDWFVFAICHSISVFSSNSLPVNINSQLHMYVSHYHLFEPRWSGFCPLCINKIKLKKRDSLCCWCFAPLFWMCWTTLFQEKATAMCPISICVLSLVSPASEISCHCSSHP